jgi:hypothetical protein
MYSQSSVNGVKLYKPEEYGSLDAASLEGLNIRTQLSDTVSLGS